MTVQQGTEPEYVSPFHDDTHSPKDTLICVQTRPLYNAIAGDMIFVTTIICVKTIIGNLFCLKIYRLKK